MHLVTSLVFLINISTAHEIHTTDMSNFIFHSAGTGVPIVLLVLEGGGNTLKTAAEAICNGTPVVVVAGSGRAADFIVHAMSAR